MAQVRIQKILAQAGLASRRKAEAFITEGRVEVNAKVVRELGARADPKHDLIRVDGKLIGDAEDQVYYILYKPPSVVTTMSDPEGRKTVHDLVGDIEERVFPVGRLDFDAEGAVILTNDGALANRLMHPRYGARRTYLAKVKGEPDEKSLARMMSGLRLVDGRAKALEAAVHSHTPKNTWLRIVVNEGRKHMVKNLCEAVGHPVQRLFRVDYAGVGVDGMRPGEIRRLETREVAQLKKDDLGAVRSGPVRMPARRHGRTPGGGPARKPATAAPALTVRPSRAAPRTPRRRP